MQLIHHTFLTSLAVFNPGNIIGLAHVTIKAISTLEGQCATGSARRTGTAILELGECKVKRFKRESCSNVSRASPSKQGFCIL
jgi:hypothetical protein